MKMKNVACSAPASLTFVVYSGFISDIGFFNSVASTSHTFYPKL